MSLIRIEFSQKGTFVNTKKVNDIQNIALFAIPHRSPFPNFPLCIITLESNSNSILEADHRQGLVHSYFEVIGYPVHQASVNEYLRVKWSL